MKLAVETKVKTNKIVVKLDVLWVVSIKIKVSIAFVVGKIYALANPATSLRKSGGAIAPPAPPVPTPMTQYHACKLIVLSCATDRVPWQW